MYSRNDYRYYLEHRLEESDDYLTHYGVKGMRKGQHLPQVLERLRKARDEKYRINPVVKGVDTVEGVGRDSIQKVNAGIEKKAHNLVQNTRNGVHDSARAITKKKKKRKSLKQRYMDYLKKTQKVEVIDRIDQRTGKHF